LFSVIATCAYIHHVQVEVCKPIACQW